MESNPALGLLGFWMFLQLIVTIALVLGGIYMMFCLGRAASGLDRMANAMEDWVAQQNAQLQSQQKPPTVSPVPPNLAHSPVPPPVSPASAPSPIISHSQSPLTDEPKRES